jgi:hypoxanthine phosphoribosyltransferase
MKPCLRLVYKCIYLGSKVFRKNYEFLSPTAVDTLIEDLVKQLRISDFEPQVIVAIDTGGCYAGNQIAAATNVMLDTIDIRQYTLNVLGVNLVYLPLVVTVLRYLGKMKQARYIGGPVTDVGGKLVLLVDDDIEHGTTLALAKRKLMEMGAAGIRTVVLSPNNLPGEVDFFPGNLYQVAPEVLFKKRHYGETFRFKWPWEPISPYHGQL